jgi:translation initiation factor eIF-2B subunit epsilon
VRTGADASREQRWAYPLVPDINLLGRTTFSFSWGNIYKEKGVASRCVPLAMRRAGRETRGCADGRRDARIRDNTVIGAGTFIGAGATVTESVIGRDCRIGAQTRPVAALLTHACASTGPGASVSGSYLFSGVSVEDGAVVERAILADGVIVRKVPSRRRNRA